MANLVEVKVPDLGGYKGVDVLEILVKPGAKVAIDDPLVTLSSDKASMDVPSTVAGVVKEVKVKAGGKVDEGDVVVVIESESVQSTTSASPLPVAVGPAVSGREGAGGEGRPRVDPSPATSASRSDSTPAVPEQRSRTAGDQPASDPSPPRPPLPRGEGEK